MTIRHTLVALAVPAALLASTPGTATAAPAPSPAAAARQSATADGFTDVMRFGSALKGTPLAQTAPTADTVFTLIKRATQTPEVKQITVDASGAVVENHVFELTDTWREGWTEGQIDASATNDVWAVADGTLWHLADGPRATKVTLPAGVTRVVAVADVAGPTAWVSAETTTGARVYRVEATSRATTFTPVDNPAGTTTAASELRWAGNHLFARFGTAIVTLRPTGWARVATAPSTDATWLARSVHQHQFVDGTAVLTRRGTVVTDRFTETARNGRTTQLAGSVDDGVFTLAASRTGDATWAVTRRGDDAWLQRRAA